MFSKHIRVRAENGEKLAAALRAAGFEAEWLGPGTAHKIWLGLGLVKKW
jgi:hypothetical protein